MRIGVAFLALAVVLLSGWLLLGEGDPLPAPTLENRPKASAESGGVTLAQPAIPEAVERTDATPLAQAESVDLDASFDGRGGLTVLARTANGRPIDHWPVKVDIPGKVFGKGHDILWQDTDDRGAVTFAPASENRTARSSVNRTRMRE